MYPLIKGPSQWHHEYPVAVEGQRQSPIDIITDDCVDGFDDERDESGESECGSGSESEKEPLKWTYNADQCLTIKNNGHTWKVEVNGCGSCKLCKKVLIFF